MLRLNWRKIVVLVLLSELLIIYWSTLQHQETVRYLKEEEARRISEQSVSAATDFSNPPDETGLVYHKS